MRVIALIIALLALLALLAAVVKIVKVHIADVVNAASAITVIATGALDNRIEVLDTFSLMYYKTSLLSICLLFTYVKSESISNINSVQTMRRMFEHPNV